MIRRILVQAELNEILSARQGAEVLQRVLPLGGLSARFLPHKKAGPSRSAVC